MVTNKLFAPEIETCFCQSVICRRGQWELSFSSYFICLSTLATALLPFYNRPNHRPSQSRSNLEPVRATHLRVPIPT